MFLKQSDGLSPVSYTHLNGFLQTYTSTTEHHFRRILLHQRHIERTMLSHVFSNFVTCLLYTSITMLLMPLLPTAFARHTMRAEELRRNLTARRCSWVCS